MTCVDTEPQLARYVAGDLAGEPLARLRAHLAECPACRALVVEATRPIPSDAGAAGEAIVAGVMARTSGSACAAAETELHAFVSGELAPGEAELVALHLSSCTACRALAEILTWAPGLCREIALAEPPPGFTEEVLRSTTLARTGLQAGRGLRRAWRRVVMRPRFSVELAYAGALVAVLLVATPKAPLRHLLPEASRLARTNPVELMVAGVESGGVGPTVLSALDWGYTHTLRRVVATRRVVEDASTHAGDLAEAILAGDIGTVSVQLRKVGGDLERLLQAIGHGVTGVSAHPHNERET